MAATSYHPKILSSKYEQTVNVNPLTANYSLLFVVRWPNLDHEMKIKKIPCPSEKLLLKLTNFCAVVPTRIFSHIYFILTK